MFPPGIPLIKRLLDLLLTTVGLILFSPLLLALALVVRHQLGSPLLFRQQRPGYSGEARADEEHENRDDRRESEGLLHYLRNNQIIF